MPAFAGSLSLKGRYPESPMSYGKPYTEVYLHLIWATYDRLPLIRPTHETRLYAAIWEKALELRCDPIAIGGTEDHVHLLCRLHPTVSISHLVQMVKGVSSHHMSFLMDDGVKFRWQGSYGVFSVHARAVPTVRAYVQNQRKHHADQTTHATWEQVMEVAGPSV